MTVSEHANVLVAEAGAGHAESTADILRSMGHACTVETGFQEALAAACSGNFEIILTGLDFGGPGRGWEILHAAKNALPDVHVIFIADRDDARTVVTTVHARGAAGFLHRPLNHAKLAVAMEAALQYVRLLRDRNSLQRLVEDGYRFGNIVGKSAAMNKVFQRTRQAAATDATVLIQGETGTGKELVARAIHFNGSRRNNRFVPLNCAGLVETILESELFGHEKGAFTGATTSRTGMFEHASGGTLFLDEIGDMPPSSQVKLLRVLEQDEIVRVGSNEPVKVDVRVIAATHQDLHEQVERGAFRKDLFYRLSVVTIPLPPLRERREDISLLIKHFIRQLSEHHAKRPPALGHDVIKFLYRYDWPGNVRELRNCLEHMIVLTDDAVLSEKELPEYLFKQMKLLPSPDSRADITAGQPLEDIEKVHIERTLELVDGNREKAADLLGIGERTLYRKIKKYGLD